MNLQINPLQIQSFIKLFKVYPENTLSGESVNRNSCFNRGFLFTDNSNRILSKVGSIEFNAASAFFGTQTELFNNTFYKSFGTVTKATAEQLLFDQILYYITTHTSVAFIPAQELDLPDLCLEKVKFVVIKRLPLVLCINRLNSYLKTAISPSAATVELIRPLMPLCTINTDEIVSFELQVIKHQLDKTVPSNPINQLRYLVYSATEETLLIKNKYLIDKIKAAHWNYSAAQDILSKCDLAGLASIFLRYKPLFLAFKSYSGCSPIINKIRRLSDTYHETLNSASLQNLLSITDPQKQKEIIQHATNRDLVKLLNAIYTRLAIKEPQSAAYNIRNGTTFVKENGLRPASDDKAILATHIFSVLKLRLIPSLKGKIFYIPNFIEYAVPVTEKQCIGNIPFGSYIKAAPRGAFTIGIQWFNNGVNTDIDLHLNSVTKHFGWNNQYFEDTNIVYTGDLVDAPEPQGAAEAYYFEPRDESYVLSANLYSGKPDTQFKMFMTYKKPERNYTFDPNTSLFPPIPIKFNGSSDLTLGLFCNQSFYFCGGSVSNSIVPDANYPQYISALETQLLNKCNLRILLRLCGATVIENQDNLSEQDRKRTISLAPNDLTVDTLFNIIDGKQILS